MRRPTFTAQADTYISQINPAQNYGNASQMIVQRIQYFPARENQALLQFDVSSIPADSTIISATLIAKIWFNRALASPQAPFAVLPTANLDSWTEMGVTWDNRPGDASQGDPSSSVAGNDFFTHWDVTNIVRAWNSGALLNHGFRLKPAVTEPAGIYYYTRESSSAAQLIVTYAPEPCYPATSVTIGGATQGITDTQYTFHATVLPTTATPPILYTWEADEQSEFETYDTVITYTWATTGVKTITVTASNCESSVVGVHQIEVKAPVPACEFPLTGLTLAGPTTGYVDVESVYSATPVPGNATTPLTYTWQATEQTTYTGAQATRNYTWTTPGTKLITVMAQNCGGAVSLHYPVNVQPRPDLRISSAWYNPDEQRVYYIIQNDVDGGTALGGHTTQLFNEGSPVASAPFSETLEPGAVRAGSIPYVWACAGTTGQMRVCADTADVIPESGEGNNCLERTWLCDLTPPKITFGPVVEPANIGEHTARIVWTTDEPCRSRLEYGRNGAFQTSVVSNGVPKTQHIVDLTGLESGSLYWFNVTVIDDLFNSSTSGGRFFETLPPGSDPPEIAAAGMVEYPSETYEFYILQATLVEPQYVDHVSFFLDGKSIGADCTPDGNVYEVYLSPADMGLTRAQWFRSHTLKVDAYNLKGDVTSKTVTVIPPFRKMEARAYIQKVAPSDVLYVDGSIVPADTKVTVSVHAVEYKWGCSREGNEATPPGLGVVDCGEVRQDVQKVELFLDGTSVGTYYPPAGILTHDFVVDVGGKGSGAHTFKARATSSEGIVSEHEKTLMILNGRMCVDVTRQVTRLGNYYQVALTLKNTCSTRITLKSLEDRGIVGFYPAAGEGDASYSLSKTVYDSITQRASATLTINNVSLTFGEQHTVRYVAAPILYDKQYSGNTLSYSIGYDFIGIVRYTTSAGPTVIDGYFSQPWTGSASEALEQADYLLITSPDRLRSFATLPDWRAHEGKDREYHLVLSRMAELATLRNGVLGFLSSDFTALELDALLEPRGRWAKALHPNFRGYNGTGYVLFVGEDEIIPPQGAGYGVPYSDLRYASTSGEAKPELVLGRIVGDDLGTLSQGLLNSLSVARTGVGFDRQRALLNSGRGPNESDFWTQIKGVRSRLDFPTITALRWSDIGYTADILARIQTEMALGQSLVVYRGHGGSSSWGYDDSANFTADDIASLDFNNYHPFVWGLGCSTADYRNSYSNPEGWLRYGAGGYVGAVNIAYTQRNGYATEAFFNRWGKNGALSVGSAKVDMERKHWGDSYVLEAWNWKAWIYQHPLLGDPKFGALPTLAVNAAQPVASDGPIGAIALTLPDYVVEPENGLDYVSLPEGSEWLSPTEYIVPTWKETYTYPQGQRVQTVTLTAQGGLVVATGLRLPTYTLMIDCDCAAPAVAPLQETAANADFYPEFDQDYEWRITENPDGTSTLELFIYPFTYNPASTDARFYQKWDFVIDVFSSTVDIVSLRPTQATYFLTDTVAATLLVDNSGAEQTLFVQSVVKSLSGEVQTILPLQALHAITGTALLDLVVPDPLAPGDYVLEVTALDTEGRALDTEMTEFTVGVVSGEVMDLTATPALFKPGDGIALTLTFQNTGDMTLNGAAVIRVEGATVGETVEFTHTLTALAPGGTATFDAVWDSTGATDETYRVVGYVTHDFGAFAPKEAILSTRAYIYLPLVLRSSN